MDHRGAFEAMCMELGAGRGRTARILELLLGTIHIGRELRRVATEVAHKTRAALVRVEGANW